MLDVADGLVEFYEFLLSFEPVVLVDDDLVGNYGSIVAPNLMEPMINVLAHSFADIGTLTDVDDVSERILDSVDARDDSLWA